MLTISYGSTCAVRIRFGIKHVENIGPVSTCEDTDMATHLAPHVAISERTLQSSCPVVIRLYLERPTTGSRIKWIQTERVRIHASVSAPHKWARSLIGCIWNPAPTDAGRQYLPGGMGLPHPPANQASHPGRPLIIISVGP